VAYLITGSMGCLGAWVLHHLVKGGKRAVSFDLSENRSRLNLLMNPKEQEAISFVRGDLTDFAQVFSVSKEQKIKHIIHLAALQIPFCRADPVMGAKVNVVGTVNVFEAARQAGIKHLTYASSVAVYGPPASYASSIIPADAAFDPRTLYGVYKQDNEGTARVYWQDHKLSSIALRPYTVYGVGRDQGLTSEPSKAMLAAAAKKNYEISFGGKMQFHFASDVAKQFIEAAETSVEGAFGFNLGTEPVAVAQFARLIEKAKPGVKVSSTDTLLPFPDGLESGRLKDYIKTSETALLEGIRQTIEHFETCLADGRLSAG
jgi:nucleoside-diphosphate-sugar epimerase